MIRFLLNQNQQTIENLDPNTSVLDYLREHLHRTGTKEGCASGDCGACTVVLGEPGTEGMIYSAINACITPVGSLHGKQLITVEDLKSGAKLHPVQQSMVDCHGSQCGFCTPGFVMSMFAYRKNHHQPDRESINEALGGNLCRCTGYRPIIDAAIQMFSPPREDQFSATERETLESLSAINQDTTTISLTGNGKTYFAPTTLDALAELLLDYPDARLIAGGTDLSLEITQQLQDIDILIYTGRVAALKTVQLTDAELEIGAAVSYSEVKQRLVALYPDLQELIDRLGSRQIRNQGTLGGNIGNASPIGDMPPVLIALGAKLVLRKGDVTRVIPVQDFFVGYRSTVLQTSEFIERILLPIPRPDYQFRVYKISKRLDDDISTSCAAFNLLIKDGIVENAIIAFGGMAEIPKRARNCEQTLLNEPWTEATIEVAMDELAKDFTPITDFRASANYRRKVCQNLLRRLYLELQSSANLVRVTHHA